MAVKNENVKRFRRYVEHIEYIREEVKVGPPGGVGKKIACYKVRLHLECGHKVRRQGSKSNKFEWAICEFCKEAAGWEL